MISKTPWEGLTGNMLCLNQATSSNHDFIATDKQCTMFYSTSHTKLQKVCEGATCKCVEGKFCLTCLGGVLI